MNELELLSRYRKVEPIDPALLDATVEAIVHSPDGTASARHRASGPRRGRASRLVLASASVAATVATAAVILTGAGGSTSPRPAPTLAPAQGAVLTGYVIERSLTALETASGYVERVVRHDGSGIAASWIGPNQLLDEVPGQSATLWTWAATGVDTVLSIDYQHHTWSKSTIPAPPPASRQITRPPSPLAEVTPPKALNGPEPSATSIAALFRQPGTEVTGTAIIDGTRTYQLQIPALDPNGKPVTGKSITAWVDTSTYLPVRIAQDMPAGLGPNSSAKGTSPAFTPTEDFTWEPATRQTLAVFDLKPPATFQQIADPALQPIPPGH